MDVEQECRQTLWMFSRSVGKHCGCSAGVQANIVDVQQECRQTLWMFSRTVGKWRRRRGGGGGRKRGDLF